jgi:hypothetical protein
MKLTAISNPTSAKKIAIGIKATKNMMIPDVRIGHSIPLKILSRVCPATILANSRTPRLNARAKYEINSISTSNGTIPIGVPAGTKYEKKCTPCRYNPRIVTPKKIVKLRPIDTIIEVVSVYPYGTFPLRLAIRIKKKSE